MRFESLPAELQLEVFSNLDSSDLKAARAVSRKLRDNASPALFRRVVACARYLAMGSFQNISLSPVLQRYVKEIIFDGSIYDQHVSDREELYERLNNEYDDLRSSSFWGVRTRWKRYQELYKEQEDLEKSDVLLQTMARALEWITNVSSIVYSPHPHLIPSEKKLMKDLLPRNSRGDLPGSSVRSRHPFRQLIGAIHVSLYTGIRELRIEPFDDDKPGTPFTFDFFDFPDATDIQAGRFLFQNLTTLELHIRTSCIPSGPRMRPSPGRGRRALAHLSHLLAVTDELRQLTLHIVGWTLGAASAPGLELGPRDPVFTRLGLRKTWPKLRSFNLGGVHSTGDDILDFIRRHKDTLRTLSFQDCGLYSGLWADIADEVVYNSSAFPFVLHSVNETHIPVASGIVLSAAELEEWRYEGHVEVTKDGDRRFVDSVPKKKSVYFRTI